MVTGRITRFAESSGVRAGLGASLRRNACWNLVGNSVNAACQLGVVILIAKLGDPAMLGRYALGLAIAMPVVMFTNLQLRDLLATDVHGDFRFGEYMRLRIVTLGIALLTIASIAGVSGLGRETALTLMAVAVSRAVESVSDIYLGLFQRHRRMEIGARSLIMKGPAGLAVLGSTLFFTASVSLSVLAMAAARGVLVLLYEMPRGSVMRDDGAGSTSGPDAGRHVAHRDRWGRSSPARLARMASLALPMGFVVMLGWLNSGIPRYFIEHHFGESTLGAFASVAFVFQGAEMLMRAASEAAMPRLASQFAGGDRGGFLRLLGFLAFLGIGVGGLGLVGSLFLGEHVLAILFGREYAQQRDILTWVMAAGLVAFPASALAGGATATRGFQAFPIPFLMVTLVTLGSSHILIPAYGLQGAAWAVCAWGLAYAVAPLIVLRRSGILASEIGGSFFGDQAGTKP